MRLSSANRWRPSLVFSQCSHPPEHVSPRSISNDSTFRLSASYPPAPPKSKLLITQVGFRHLEQRVISSQGNRIPCTTTNLRESFSSSPRRTPRARAQHGRLQDPC